MKKKCINSISVLLFISTLLFIIPVHAFAAGSLEGIEFIKSSTSLAIGKSETLKIKSIPSGITLPKVSWSTSNKEVATISSTGLVKGVGSGWAIITAKCGKCIDKCLIKVNKTNRYNITKSSANTIVTLLKKDISNIENVIVYDEFTDPNELLGEAGEYTSKANFADDRISQYGIDDPVGGSVEVFKTANDCTKRKDYISYILKIMPVLGKEHLYQYKNVLLRVSGKLSSSQIKVYKEIFDKIS